MDAAFSVPYPEYVVINEISKIFRKVDGYSTYIPTSRQQPDVDFLLHFSKNNRCVRFQVKGSRIYPGRIGRDGKPIDYRYHLWFNNFIGKYKDDHADYYVLFGLYPSYNIDSKISAKYDHWDHIILCVPDVEMGKILRSILTKKEKKSDRFFGIGFNSPDRVFGTRGYAHPRELSDFLLANKIESIKELVRS